MSRFIPVNEPDIPKVAKDNVIEALKTGWISSAGKFVSQFENGFSDYIGVKYGVAVTSCAAAMHVSLLALGIGPGDEVIVPAFTMGATWFVVIYVGAKPVFVDCELDTYNIDPSLIEAKITSRTKAIMPVHIYGHPCEMDKIMKIARKHKLYVVEDAAEAHGAEYKERKCGSFGNFGCFSFYGNKILTTGEGGMTVTNSERLADKARRFKDYSFLPSKRFIHDNIGYNYRLTNMQAAFGCGALTKMDHYLKKKKKMASLYEKHLGNIPGIRLPITKANCSNVYWMYAVLVDTRKYGMSKNQLREKLAKAGIGTRDFFYPPQMHKPIRPYLKKSDRFPNTSFISKRGLYLPSGLAITNAQIVKVCKTIKDLHLKAKR